MSSWKFCKRSDPILMLVGLKTSIHLNNCHINGFRALWGSRCLGLHLSIRNMVKIFSTKCQGPCEHLLRSKLQWHGRCRARRSRFPEQGSWRSRINICTSQMMEKGPCAWMREGSERHAQVCMGRWKMPVAEDTDPSPAHLASVEPFLTFHVILSHSQG